MRRKQLAIVIIYGLIVLILFDLWKMKNQQKVEAIVMDDVQVVKSTSEPQETPLVTPEPRPEHSPTQKPLKYKLTRKDQTILAKIIQAEAGGQDLKGKILVGNVIMNRVKDSNYPDSVEKVVYAHSGGVYQFSPVFDGRINTVKISEETELAVKKVMKGVDYSHGAQFFMCRRMASKKNRIWFDTHLERLFSYGAHEFFRR